MREIFGSWQAVLVSALLATAFAAVMWGLEVRSSNQDEDRCSVKGGVLVEGAEKTVCVSRNVIIK